MFILDASHGSHAILDARFSSSHVCSIEDGALKIFYVAREEEASCDWVCLIVNPRRRCPRASIEVHLARLI